MAAAIPAASPVLRQETITRILPLECIPDRCEFSVNKVTKFDDEFKTHNVFGIYNIVGA